MNENDTTWIVSLLLELNEGKRKGCLLDLCRPPRRDVHLCEAVLFYLAERRHGEDSMRRVDREEG